jgi:hypothetical protein
MSKEFEDFKREQAEKAAKSRESFDIPDRIIVQEDVKMWNVTGVVCHLAKGTDFVVPDLVPVVTNEKNLDSIVGAASFTKTDYHRDDEEYRAHASLSAHIPERLDYDLGVPFTLLPIWNWEEKRLLGLWLRKSKDGVPNYFAVGHFDISTEGPL